MRAHLKEPDVTQHSHEPPETSLGGTCCDINTHTHKKQKKTGHVKTLWMFLAAAPVFCVTNLKQQGLIQFVGLKMLKSVTSKSETGTESVLISPNESFSSKNLKRNDPQCVPHKIFFLFVNIVTPHLDTLSQP